MFRLNRMLSVCFLAVTIVSATAAQEGANSIAQRSSLTITATAIGDRVRITAPASVVQMRVEVYAASGEKLFDQEIRGGNVFDWHLQDGQAQRLAPGTYVCVVTAKSISGRLTQKIGTVSVAEKSVSVQAADSRQLSAAQAQPIGPVEENPSWTIAAKDEPQTPTVIANDGTDGQLIRGRGALTFRIGNFFSGIDTEQMRLTEAGNLGIGTSEPKAKLDVAGTIRAERFLVVKPGQTSKAAGDSEQTIQAVASIQPLISGTGTQNQIAKWTDSVGTLGDSGITETAGGLVGIGTTSPTTKLHIFGAETADTFAGMGVDPSSFTGGALNFGMGGHSWGKGSGFINVRRTADGTLPTFRFMTNGIERIFIDQAGNVGIGTTTPAKHLHIFGAGDQEIAIESSDTNGRRWTLQSSRGTADGNFQIIDRTANANRFTILSNGNVGIGSPTPARALHILGGGDQELAIESSDANGRQWTLQSAKGASNGRFEIIDRTAAANRFTILSNGNVGLGTTSPSNRLSVIGNANIDGDLQVGDRLRVATIEVTTFPPFGDFPACFNDNIEISQCNSSSIRYKTNLTPLVSGLGLVRRLRPVAFDWKRDGKRDFGLIAEDVAEVAPLLVYHNKDGQVEGVRYDRLPVVLINAVKEQQTQIEQQQGQLKTQQLLIQQQQTRLARQQVQLNQEQQQLGALKRLVRHSHSKAALCK